MALSIIFLENLISELPSSISNLAHLRILDVSSNKIRCLPITLYAMEELQTLKIDADKMEFPPSGFIATIDLISLLYFILFICLFIYFFGMFGLELKNFLKLEK